MRWFATAHARPGCHGPRHRKAAQASDCPLGPQAVRHGTWCMPPLSAAPGKDIRARGICQCVTDTTAVRGAKTTERARAAQGRSELAEMSVPPLAAAPRSAHSSAITASVCATSTCSSRPLAACPPASPAAASAVHRTVTAGSTLCAVTHGCVGCWRLGPVRRVRRERLGFPRRARGRMGVAADCAPGRDARGRAEEVL